LLPYTQIQRRFCRQSAAANSGDEAKAEAQSTEPYIGNPAFGTFRLDDSARLHLAIAWKVDFELMKLLWKGRMYLQAQDSLSARHELEPEAGA